MSEARDSEKQSKRFQLYKDLLGEDSLYGRAVRRTEGEMKLSANRKLYLYGFIPAIMEFSGWVLEEAVRTGKKRLYFLSRDGYQMYLAACKLTELRKLPIECRYLHVSRYAMRVPAYHLDIQRSINWICSSGIEVTLERVLKRGALTDEEAREVAERIGRKDTYRDSLSRHQIAELKEILGYDFQFLQYIETHSMEAYENAMGYLQQEGLFSDVPYAIVDSGWVGTFQQALQLLIQSRMPDIRLEGYYFGLYEIPPDADAKEYHGWYFTPGTGLRRKVYFSNSFFEAVCSADEGMTVGYCRKNGEYLPYLDSEGNLNGEKLRQNLGVLKHFLEKYTKIQEEIYTNSGGSLETDVKGTASIKTYRIKDQKCTCDGRILVNKLFMLLMATPFTVETESFGEFLFSDDVLTGNCREVAVRLTREEVRNLYILRRLSILSGLRKGVIRESAWIEGSIVRGGCGRQDLRHIRWYKYLVYGRKQVKSWLHTVRQAYRNSRLEN